MRELSFTLPQLICPNCRIEKTPTLGSELVMIFQKNSSVMRIACELCDWEMLIDPSKTQIICTVPDPTKTR